MLVWVALVIVYILWGSTYLGIRIAVETMPPLLMAGVRFAIAGATVIAWRLPAALRSRQPVTLLHWRSALLIGAGLMLGGNGGVAVAERTVPSGITALIVAVVPLWMALIDRVVYKRKLRPLTIAGLVVSFGCVAYLIGWPGPQRIDVAGALIVVAATIAWAVGSLYSRNAPLPNDGFLAIGMEMVAGGALLCLSALLTGEFRHLQLGAISAASLWALGYLIVFGAIVGFSAYLWLLRTAPTSLVSTYAYVNPVVAVLLGNSWLGEPIGPRVLVAGALIFGSVVAIVSGSGAAGKNKSANS